LGPSALLYASSNNQSEQIFVGGDKGEIHLYEIEQQTKVNLMQTFPTEHPSRCWISSFLRPSENTLISSAYFFDPSLDSANAIVVWTKSKANTSYDPLQRIAQQEAGKMVAKLVLMNREDKDVEEEEFASSSHKSIIIWTRRRKGGEEGFKIKQKIINEGYVMPLLYIQLTNELISGSYSPSLLQIWSSQSYASSDFKESQSIDIDVCSLCQIDENGNDSRRIEFASGHENGKIMIWSRQQTTSNYSPIRTLKPFYQNVNSLIFINDNGRFNFSGFLFV
jgi:hypothetical protein